MSTSTLERRVEALEAAAGGDGGCPSCPRCVGTLIIIGNAEAKPGSPGEFHSASWNGEPITAEELRERQSERSSERKCSRCGRKIEPDEAVEIRIGRRSFALR
jgi:ribosomal protein L37AE/L43A